MRFLTYDESRTWAEGLGYTYSPEQVPSAAPCALPHVRVGLPSEPANLFGFSRALCGYLEPRASCLLWVVTWGVWPTAENWHLYYRLRQSYGDPRLLHEAPGHLFLDYEEPDLVSFLEIAFLSGWDAHILPHLSYGVQETARIFISHDEWVVLAHRDETVVDGWRDDFQKAGHSILPGR